MIIGLPEPFIGMILLMVKVSFRDSVLASGTFGTAVTQVPTLSKPEELTYTVPPVELNKPALEAALS